MRRFWVLLMVIFGMMAAGCSHQLTITNLNEHYSTPPAPPQEPVSVGVVSGQTSDPVNNKYVYAIVTAMRNSGNFERVIYPYSHYGYYVGSKITRAVYASLPENQ